MKPFARVALPALAALLVSAAPAEQVIPFPGENEEALIIASDSPVQFGGFDKDQEGSEYVGAHFRGRFVLTGSYTYGCEWDCGEPGVTEAENFALRVVPDHDIAARLPHWKKHRNDIVIFVTGAQKFTHSVTTPRQRKMFASGKLAPVQGRIAIVVDKFETSLDCDSANFGADFVAIAKPTKVAKVDLEGHFGCG